MGWYLQVPDLTSPGKFHTSETFDEIEDLAEWLYRNWGLTFLGRKLTVAIETDDPPVTPAPDGPDSHT